MAFLNGSKMSTFLTPFRLRLDLSLTSSFRFIICELILTDSPQNVKRLTMDLKDERTSYE